MKYSLGYNSLVLALVTGFTLSTTACGGGSSSSSANVVDTPKKVIPAPTPKKDKVSPATPANPPSVSSGETGCGSLSKKEMLKKINELRSQSRVCYQTNKRYKAARALKWNNTLEKSTQKFANDMAKHNYYNYFGSNAHLQPDTSKAKVNGRWQVKDAINFTDRSQEYKYLIPNKIGGFVRENLAWSNNPRNPSIKKAVETAYYGDGETSKGWLQSKHGHCENIMNPQVEDFAMTCAYNAKTGKYYFVQMFGVQCKTVDECRKKGIKVLVR